MQEEVIKMHEAFCGENDRWETYGPCLKFKIHHEFMEPSKAEVDALVEKGTPLKEAWRAVRQNETRRKLSGTNSLRALSHDDVAVVPRRTDPLGPGRRCVPRGRECC